MLSVESLPTKLESSKITVGDTALESLHLIKSWKGRGRESTKVGHSEECPAELSVQDG
jgi:hypothetical protein